MEGVEAEPGRGNKIRIKAMIKAINLNKTYYQGKTKIEAVRDASLEIRERESVLITGQSGAGKSTLLHLLGGLEKPTKGMLFVDDTDFYKLNDKARSEVRNEKIGFVFQFYHLLPEFSVTENVMFPALIGRKKDFKNKKDIKERTRYLLEMVGLGRRANHRPVELSGGESQRAAIARALINFPDTLLCDEPTGNLDSRIGKEVVECLWMLKEREGMSIIFVTHDENIEKGFDKKFKIQDGTMEELKDGSPSLPEWQVHR